MSKYIRNHSLLWTIGLILPPVAALTTNLTFAYALQAYSAELIRPDAVFERVVVIMLATMAILVLSTIIEDVARYIFIIFIVKTENHLRQDLFSRILHARYTELGGIDRSELLTRYNTDTGTATNLVTWDIFAVLWPVILGGGYLVSLFHANLIIGFVMLCLCVTVVLLNVFFVKWFAELERVGLERREDFTQAVNSGIRGKMSVRLMSAGAILSEWIKQEADQMYDNENRKVKLSALRAVTLELFATICGALTAPLACILAATGKMSLASVVLVAQLCRYLILYTNGFGVALTGFQTHMVSLKRLKKVLDITGEYVGLDEASLRQDEETALEFHQVDICYGECAILKDVNLNVRRGEIVALVGTSGSGKSSIMKALLRLIDYTGDIKLFGCSIDTIPLHTLRQSISYVPEHSDIFNATVMENLSYAASNADMGRMYEVLGKAGLDIMEIAEREVGESGGEISGGQRQRVAIARALMKDAPLMILDEPTASLDAETEGRVLETLLELKKQGKSMLIVTHRPSTMQIADRLLLVQDHRVLSDLSYEEVVSALYTQSHKTA